MLDDARVVGLAQEPREGAGRSDGEELEVGELARVEDEDGERPRAPPQRRGLLGGDDPVHEHAAVGRHREERRVLGHDGWAPFHRGDGEEVGTDGRA